jgi:hypothetical protein
MPKPLPVQPGGFWSARAQGALNKRKSRPANKAAKAKRPGAFRKMDDAALAWNESREG